MNDEVPEDAEDRFLRWLTHGLPLRAVIALVVGCTLIEGVWQAYLAVKP